MAVEEVSFIQERKYQSNLLTILQNIYYSGHQPPPVLVELDCGMGKRVLSFLLVQKYFPTLKTLILLQATSSLAETQDYFVNRYKMTDIGVLGSTTRPQMREYILKKYRVVLATPQTLANVLEKNPESDFGFQLILINEVDKIIRRTATRRTLVFPYPQLLERMGQAWVIGLSGTLRDSHLVVTDTVRLHEELQTLAENFPNVRIISMDEIISSDPDINKHIEYTLLKAHGVQDLHLTNIFHHLDELVKSYRQKILEQAREEGLITEQTKNLALIAGQLPVDSDLTGKYEALLMMRKYLTAMLPIKFKPFLYRIPEIKKEEIDQISDKSVKLQIIPKLIAKTQKTVIMVSYIYTGEIIQKYLETAGFKTFFVSGMIHDKSTVVNAFRNCDASQVALIMTQVGERDLDIPEAKLIIVYDIVNTTKTMYQRFKRTRGGEVICLYYKDTSEKDKIKRLFNDIREKYSWSTTIEEVN